MPTVISTSWLPAGRLSRERTLSWKTPATRPGGGAGIDNFRGAAADGLEGDGATLVDLADYEFAGGDRRGGGEVEADEGGIGVGGEFEIVLEELGAGVEDEEDEIDTGIELGVADGFGVGEVTGPFGGIVAAKDVGAGGRDLFLPGKNGAGTGER